MARPRAQCGTVSAYRRHVRLGEEPCEACRSANAEARRTARAKSRPGGSKRPGERASAAAQVDVVGDLERLRALLKGQLAQAAEDSPQLVPALSRELREVVKALHAIHSEEAKPVAEVVVDEFALARAARAARASGA